MTLGEQVRLSIVVGLVGVGLTGVVFALDVRELAFAIPATSVVLAFVVPQGLVFLVTKFQIWRDQKGIDELERRVDSVQDRLSKTMTKSGASRMKKTLVDLEKKLGEKYAKWPD